MMGACTCGRRVIVRTSFGFSIWRISFRVGSSRLSVLPFLRKARRCGHRLEAWRTPVKSAIQAGSAGWDAARSRRTSLRDFTDFLALYPRASQAALDGALA